MKQPRTQHSEPAFRTAHALFVAFDSRAADHLVPIETSAYLGVARCEFTDDGQHQPDEWLDLKVTTAAEAASALDALDDALTELIATSTALPDTLRLIRSRDLVREGRASR